jgi:hypothetical protein
MDSILFLLFLFVVAVSIFFIILYNIVRNAVEDGILNALLKFERMKTQESKTKDFNSF